MSDLRQVLRKNLGVMYSQVNRAHPYMVTKVNYRDDLLCPIENYAFITVDNLRLLLLGETHIYTCNPQSFILRNIKKICDKYDCVFVEDNDTKDVWSEYVLPKLYGENSDTPIAQIYHEIEDSIITDPREAYYRYCLSTFSKETGTEVSLIMPDDISTAFPNFCYIRFHNDYNEGERREMVKVCLRVLFWMNAQSRRKTKETMAQFFSDRHEYISDKLIQACMKATFVTSGHRGSMARDNSLFLDNILVGNPEKGPRYTSYHLPMSKLDLFIRGIDMNDAENCLEKFIQYFINVTVVEHSLVYNILTRSPSCNKAIGVYGAAHLYVFASVCRDFFKTPEIKIYLTKFEPDELIREMGDVGLFDDDNKKSDNMSWGEWFVDKMAKYNFINKEERLLALTEKNSKEFLKKVMRKDRYKPYSTKR